MALHRLCLFLILVFSLISGCASESESEEHAESGNPTLDGLNSAIRENPDDADVYARRARFYYGLEAYQPAIEDMARAMRLDSANADYHHLLADIYMDSYQSQRALTTMERAAALFPERIPTLLKLAENQLILKQFAAAQETVRKILELDAQNIEGIFMLALIFREMGDLEKAASTLQTAVELDSEFLDGWLVLGRIYEDLGDQRALQCYINATEIDTNSVFAWHSRAFYLQNQDAIPEALEIYKRIHRIDNRYRDAYLNAGILYLEMDSLEKARAEFSILSKISPAFPLAYFYLGEVHMLEGDTLEAKRAYERAVSLDPELERASRALEALGRFDDIE